MNTILTKIKYLFRKTFRIKAYKMYNVKYVEIIVKCMILITTIKQLKLLSWSNYKTKTSLIDNAVILFILI